MNAKLLGEGKVVRVIDNMFVLLKSQYAKISALSDNKMIRVASQYLPGSDELIEQLLASKSVNNEQPNVVVYGVYNAGKSSLLNSLTGHVEKEYFATRDIPETKATKILVHDGLCYLDTPGLDVNAQDTQTAVEGSRQADIIMLVHKLGAGSIQRQDLQAMQQLVDAHGEYAHVITVLTEGENASCNQHLIEEITQQLRMAISDFTPFVVSNTSFRKGVLEGKQALVHFSGIPQLLEHLQDNKRDITQRLAATRAEKQASLKRQIMQRLEERQEELKLGLKSDQSDQGYYEHGLVSAVKYIQSKVMKANT